MVVRTPEEFFRALSVVEAMARSAQSRIDEENMGLTSRGALALMGRHQVSPHAGHLAGGRMKRLQEKADSLFEMADKLEAIAYSLIARLPTSRMATVVAETCVNGRQIDETAALLGVSRRTVKRDLDQAMSILGSQFDKIEAPVPSDIERYLAGGAMGCTG